MSRLIRALQASLGALMAASLCGSAWPATSADELVRHGEYLATAGDCIACHTAPGGKPMAGGLSLPTPLGAIVSTNITPSRTHGIGGYTLAQFSAALRRGVRADGQNLYPAMPYPSYAKVSDEDMQALYAYFMQGVAPVDAAPPAATHLPFPFNLRFTLTPWNWRYLDRQPFAPDAGKSAAWNRGAYLVTGLTHCSTCHTPRNTFMAENHSRELAGGAVGPWFAPNITSDANSGVGGWSVQELVSYLRDGHTAGKAQAAGPMAEAVDFSLRHLSEPDLQAIATYLKSVPAVHDSADEKPAHAWGEAHDELASLRGVPWPDDPSRLSGPQLYDAYCATCHQARGQGSFDGSLPPLFHNTALGRANTDNLVMVMLEGLHRHPDVRMPGFAHELGDAQIATLGNYLTQHYGNPKAQVTAEQVRTLRAGGPGSSLLTMARVGLGVAAVLMLLIVAALLRRSR